MDMRIILVEHPIDESLCEEVGEALATGSIVALYHEAAVTTGSPASMYTASSSCAIIFAPVAAFTAAAPPVWS